jgi:hypothetical protein
MEARKNSGARAKPHCLSLLFAEKLSLSFQGPLSPEVRVLTEEEWAALENV